MPSREKGEKLNEFMARFMDAKREKSKFPNVKQRLAVGYHEARENDRKLRKQ